MKKVAFITMILLSLNLIASEIVYLADCKQNTALGPRDIEIAKINTEVGANIEGGPYGYFYAIAWDNQIQIKAEENYFSYTATSDVYSHVSINFETGRGRIQQRLLPTYYNCLSGGNPSACLIFNEILYSCEKRDYTPSLFE